MSQQINLFDPALRKQRDLWTSRTLVGVLGATLILLGSWAAWAHFQKSSLEKQLAELTPKTESAKAEIKQMGDQLANRKPDARLEAELVGARARLAARGEVLAILKKGLAPEAPNQAELLRGFARQIPNGLWLTGFNVNAETGALNIKGRTLDPALIPEYVRRLGEERAFRGRTFAALEITSGQAPVVGNTAVASPALALVGAPVPTASPAVAESKPVLPAFHEFELKSALVDAPASTLTGTKP